MCVCVRARVYVARQKYNYIVFDRIRSRRKVYEIPLGPTADTGDGATTVLVFSRARRRSLPNGGPLLTATGRALSAATAVRRPTRPRLPVGIRARAVRERYPSVCSPAARSSPVFHSPRDAARTAIRRRYNARAAGPNDSWHDASRRTGGARKSFRTFRGTPPLSGYALERRRVPYLSPAQWFRTLTPGTPFNRIPSEYVRSRAIVRYTVVKEKK